MRRVARLALARSPRGRRASTFAWRARLPELPLIHDAFAHGELSYAKGAGVTRVATAENEEELLELARVFTAAQLERAVRAYRRVTSEESRDLQEAAYLDVFWEPDGSLAIHGRLVPEGGALFLRALDALRDRRVLGDSSAVPRNRGPRGRRRARRRWSRSPTPQSPPFRRGPSGRRALPGRRRRRRREGALSHDGEGGCELDDGSAVSPETARRLACDASVVRNGRKTRAIPPAVRRALRARSPAAAASPAARTAASSTPTTSTTGQRRWSDDHGGNLLLLCRRHHRLVHEGGYRVDRHGQVLRPPGEGGGPTFRGRRRGSPLELMEHNRSLAIDAEDVRSRHRATR